MNELHKRLKSFTYAWKGVCSFLSKEHNAWIHCAAIIAVTIAGIRFEITRTEWLVILLCFAMVLAAEAFNTAIERLVNLVSPDYHPIAGDVKDIAAGAVLICAIFAALIGLSLIPIGRCRRLNRCRSRWSPDP